MGSVPDGVGSQKSQRETGGGVGGDGRRLDLRCVDQNSRVDSRLRY